MNRWAFPPAADAGRFPQTWRAVLSKAITPLWWGGWLAAVAAAVWPTREEPVDVDPAEGIVLVVAVDRSGSMRRTDVDGRPRIEAVADVAAEFLTGRTGLLNEAGRLAGASARPEDLIGLVTFAAAARTEVLPTLDHDLVAGRLAAVETARGVREDGTAIGDAIALAVAQVETVVGPSRGESTLGSSAGRAVLLLTDGQHNAGLLSPAVAAEVSRRKDVRVYVVSVRPDEAPAAVWDASDRQLRGVSERTGGRWFRAGDAAGLEAVIAEVDSLERRVVGRRRGAVRTSSAVDGPVPIAAVAVVLLAATVILRDGVCRRAGGAL